jgi:single-stranded-DNA-specific exonuclease
MDLKWELLNDDFGTDVNSLSEILNVPPIISRILLRRGVDSLEKAKMFFRSSLDQLNDPFLMKDMDKAVERLRRAVLSDENILIYGDYDVDGITSISFLYLILREIGAKVHYYIPDRQLEGYGLSQKGIDYARQLGTGLIVTVDCGITGHKEINYARSLGMDLIVSDHHEPSRELPDAAAVLDPKRSDCNYPFKQLAGVGVTYKLAQGLLQRMNIDQSILEKYIELVAIGTSADIVPLVDENRIFVKHGLARLNETENIGLAALINAANLRNREIGTGQIVFILAPRINAVGRMGDAERAVRLLTTSDVDEAREIAGILEQENRYRKSVDEETFRDALEQAGREFQPEQTRTLILHKQGWHSGVIGIVASRVVEKYYRPTILITIEDGIGKGSARSIEGFDLYGALKECEDLLLAFGGHKYAAGLSIASDKIAEFKKRFEQIARQRIKDEHLIPKLTIDSELRLNEINSRFIKLLKLFAPYGPQNMRPVFVSHDLEVIGNPTVVGTNHLRFKIRQNGQAFDVIAFGMADLYYRLVPGDRDLKLAYVIEENEYMGKTTIQLRAKDLR